jgi:hypothetical protein
MALPPLLELNEPEELSLELELELELELVEEDEPV